MWKAATVALRHASRRSRHHSTPWLGRLGSSVHAGPNLTSSLTFSWGSSSISRSEGPIPIDWLWRYKTRIIGFDHLKPFPHSIDWRKEGYVTSVKSQGIGSNTCWVFGSVVAMEFRNKKETGDLRDLSNRHIIENCEMDARMGGKAQWAFDFARRIGVHYDSDYPSKKGSKPVFKIKDFRSGYLCGKDEELIRVVSNQVVTVHLTLPKSFIGYSGGLFEGTRPIWKHEALRHCLAIVGFENNYWLLKNSAGTKWGESGYMRMSRETLLETLDLFFFPVL